MYVLFRSASFNQRGWVEGPIKPEIRIGDQCRRVPPAAAHPYSRPVESADDVGGLGIEVPPVFGGLRVGGVLVLSTTVILTDGRLNAGCGTQQSTLRVSRAGDR